jgi:signal transduction histidine kinase/CheY-like chemotaxis protein
MAVLLVMLTAVIYNILHKADAIGKKVSRSVQITNRLKEVLNTVIDAEAAERGYIITKNVAFLKPYITANQNKPSTINGDSLLAFMPEYKERVVLLNGLINEKITYVNNVIAAIGAGNQRQAIDITNTGKGTILIDSIRSVINEMQITENNKVNNIYNEQLGYNKTILLLLIADVACCILLLIVFYQMVLRNARLREKTEADLVTSKNLAETANKAKTNFLALLSHEIRTPMHDIIATSSLLSETGITDEQQALSNNIYRGCMALLSVVNDIIDFSRIESGTIPLENTPFVLHDCLEEVFSAAAPSRLPGRRLYYIDENIPELIECDPARLRQVLLSILGNSPTAIENGEIGLSVRLVSSTNDVLNIRFTIMNTSSSNFNNPGELNLATDENGEKMENNLFGISSLRLSITARLISLMGGTIKLMDENNKGNTVTFTIKANKVDVKSSELFFAKRKKIELLDTKMAANLPLAILVADDYEMNLILLVQILAKMGYTCKTARNGAEAAGLAVDTPFDIIFMDIVMPVMDGIEATKRIREYYVQSDTPLIIGVTANALMKDNKRGAEAGMNDFLIKPYKPIDVQELLKKWASHALKPKYEA